MKKFYSFVATAMLGALTFTATAQEGYEILENLTSKIQNSDFSADAAVTTKVCTYSYDINEENNEIYGQQDVTGWTNVFPSDNIKRTREEVDGGASPNNARAAAIFTYLTGLEEDIAAKLGGEYYAPDQTFCTSVTGGKALGMVAVWGAQVQYTQPITLPAGAYMIVVPVMNTAGTGAVNSFNGFIADGGSRYLSTRTTYTVGTQENDVIAFKLTEETSGVISVGYQCNGSYGSGTAPHLYADCVQLYRIDSTPLDAEEIAAAKEELLKVIEESDQYGVDAKEAQAVYDNAKASLAEVNAAIEALKEKIEASKTDLSEFFITNPHFNLDDPIADGICTYDYDMEKNGVTHYGMQPLAGWVASNPTGDPNTGNARACGVFAIGGSAFLGGSAYPVPATMSDGTTEGKVLGFISVWSAVSQYTQAVTIPAGKYTFTVSYYNAGGTGAVAKNLMGFVSDEGEEYLCDVTSFKVGQWEKMSVFFELVEATSGKFTLGYQAANAGSGSMPHFYIDGINLNYVGEIDFDPSLLALQAAVSSATNLIDEPMYSGTREQLQAVIATGDALVKTQSADVEANKAATDGINSLLPEVNNSIKAYGRLQTLITALEDDSNDKELCAIGNMAELVSNMLDAMNEAYEEGTLTTEQIEAKVAERDTMIKDEILRVLNSGEGEGTDLTRLLKNPGFDTDAAGWEGTAPTVRAGVAEFYNKTFDMYQTLEGLPAGKYEIKVSGFHRYDTNDNALAAHIGGYEQESIAAYIYGNNESTKFKSIFDGATFEGQQTFTKEDGTQVQYVYDPTDAETSIGYVPFSMEGFAAAETMTDVYETSAVALVTDGTLRLGVRVVNNPSGSAWTIFDSFRLKYVGNQPSDYAESIIKAADELVNALDNYLNNEGVAVPQDVQSTIAAVKEEADNVADNATSVEQCVAILDKIAAERTHLDDVAAKVGTFAGLVTYYEAAAYEFEIDFAALDKYYSKTDEGWATEADLDADIAGIANEWNAQVQEGSAAATEESPYEVTAMMRNPGFSWGGNNTKQFWTIVNDYGDAAESLIEFYGKSNWQVSQEVSGLTAGWYQLSVQACYRPHQQLTDVVADRMKGEDWHDVFVFASNGEKEWQSEIMNILDAEQDLTEVVVDGANRNATLDADLVTAHRTYAAGSTLISPTGHVYTRAYFDYDPEGVTESNGGYWKNNVVTFEVKSGETITLGAKKEEVNTDGGNWTTLDNFQLFYLGTTEPTAVNDAKAKTNSATPAAIYTIGGIKIDRAAKGINIIKNADGSVTKVVK